MSQNLSEIDPTFLEDLRNSRASVEKAAKWLSSKGYPVVIRPTFERPDESERMNYSDNGDLEIMQRVEVKHRTLTFTCKNDYPFDTVIVDVCHSFDRATQKPYAYIIFNAPMTVAIVVNVRESRAHWIVVERMSRGRKRDHYECPISEVSFVRMEE